MTQAIKLKKDFEIAVSSIQDHIKNLSKNKLENEELCSKAFTHRAKMNSLATKGNWSGQEEN